MRDRKKTLLTAVVVGVIAGLIVWRNNPHESLPESCTTLHEQMRQLTINGNGFAGLVASVPEEVMEQALNDYYGGLTAERCTALLPQVSAGMEALMKTPWAPKMEDAASDSKSVLWDCHQKREQGEIKTHTASAQCSNPQIIAAYQKAGYPYMDLVQRFTEKRVELAQKLDQSSLQQAEDPAEFAKLSLQIADEERKRNTAAKK